MIELDVIEKDKSNTSKGITFTNDQQKAINGIIDFIAKPFDSKNFVVGLTGAGGTGKTFVTNYIIRNCKYTTSVIKCASPTHKACRVFGEAIDRIIKVETIQSVFGFRLNLKLEDFDPNNPQFDPLSTPKLENIKVLIIDEASMLPSKLVTYIYNKCKELKIKVIFIGDSYQLPPVNERSSIAFKRCTAGLYELKEIVRQESNNPIIDILKLLRYDIEHKTYRFISYISNHIDTFNYNENGEGFYICNRNEFINTINLKFNDKEYTSNIDMYRIIAYTNVSVTSWNNYIRNNIIKDSNKGIITKNDLIMSYVTIVDEFNRIIINNSEEYIINDIVDFIDDKYELKGYLIKFQLVHGGMITKPIFVINHTDKYTILKYNQILTNLINTAKQAVNSTRASKWRDYFKFKDNYLIAANIINKQGSIVYSRDLDYGFAITAHKSQGSTYNTVFVDANDIIYNKNGTPYTDYEEMLRRLYVSCSRASKNLIICYG